MTPGRIAAIFAVVGLVVSCSGSDETTDGTETPPDTTAVPATDTPPDERDADEVADTVASGGGDASAPTPPPSTTTPTTTPATTAVATTVPAVTEEPGPAAELGLASIELLTDADGGGTRPVLEWAPVDGAARYFVVVLSPTGSTYWAWRTAETSVPVGGSPQLEPDAAGPSISPGMSWSVMAVGDDGTPIALSDRRPISP